MIPLLSKSKTMVLENIIDEDCENDNIIKLLRGGCIIKTIIGNIQFGMPPETVKDALNMQLDVPLYYIVPTDRFNRKYGLNVAEFEFPAYYNFFVRKKRINLICTKEAEIAIRIIFQETLLGPESYEVKNNILKKIYFLRLYQRIFTILMIKMDIQIFKKN